MDYRELAVDAMLYRLAHDCMGIYPGGITENGVTTPRTEWQDGWNECMLAHSGKASQICTWLESLGEHRAAVEDLLLAERVYVSSWEKDKQPILFVNCNDTFAWGCSDAEEVALDELPALVACYGESPEYGGELWVCRKRGARPQTASYIECYPPEQWPLFDACGPERDDPDGKQRPTLERLAAYRERVQAAHPSASP